MAKQIKVGVVGCGYWGTNLIRNFRSLPDCNLKMMCDVSEHRLAHLKSLYLNGVGLDAVNRCIPPLVQSTPMPNQSRAQKVSPDSGCVLI